MAELGAPPGKPSSWRAVRHGCCHEPREIVIHDKLTWYYAREAAAAEFGCEPHEIEVTLMEEPLCAQEKEDRP